MTNKNSDECCPQFNPSHWDEKEHIWKDKLFIKGSVPQLFHQPLPWMVSKMISKLWKIAEDSKAAPKLENFLMLATDPSPWKSIFLVAVTKEVPGAENVKLSGTFLSKVFDGPFSSVRKWIKEMEQYVSSKGKKIVKLYLYYTTCPKCAKKSGHNYVVAFAEVDDK